MKTEDLYTEYVCYAQSIKTYSKCLDDTREDEIS